MKKPNLKSILAVLMASGITIAAFSDTPDVDAATNGAGSQHDPVVTLSYLEYRLDGLKTQNGSNEADRGNVRNGFSRLVLQKGEELYPGEGSSFVVYSGNAEVAGMPGLINITDGTVFPQDCSLVLYNEFLVPEDSVGIRATGKCVLFIRN